VRVCTIVATNLSRVVLSRLHDAPISFISIVGRAVLVLGAYAVAPILHLLRTSLAPPSYLEAYLY
jgi:hypothetical protein